MAIDLQRYGTTYVLLNIELTLKVEIFKKLFLRFVTFIFVIIPLFLVVW